MKTCPTCGAENREIAGECRLCASPLDRASSSSGAKFGAPLPPTSDLSANEPAGASPVGGQVVCPACKSANEPDWVFCQQCGAKLPGRESQPALSPKPGGAEPLEKKPAAGGSQSKAAEGAQPVDSPPAPTILDDEPVQGAAAPAPVDKQASTATRSPGPDISGRSAAVVCSVCGERVPRGGLYCASCGRRVSGDAAAVPPRPEGKAVVQMITEGGQTGESYSIDSGDLLIGRVEGDVTFPHDGYMSSRHAQVVKRDGRYYLVDVNSRNGTFVRIKGEIELQPGDTFLVGKQVFRFGIK